MSFKKNQGQALIMIVLIIALILTVLAAASYQLTVETASAKLQEESVRALAAADSGIEFGLKQANLAGIGIWSFQDIDLEPAGIDSVRSKIQITTTNPTSFASQRILANDQLTIYTSTSAFPDLSDSYIGTFDLYFADNGPGTCNSPRTAPALEISYISGSNGGTINRQIVEPCTTGDMISGIPITGANSVSFSIAPYTFSYKLNPNINTSTYTDLKYIIVRALFAQTRIGITGTSLPAQGKTIQSEAYSLSGASKIVQVYQSYPQVTADFFVTVF